MDGTFRAGKNTGLLWAGTVHAGEKVLADKTRRDGERSAGFGHPFAPEHPMLFQEGCDSPCRFPVDVYSVFTFEARYILHMEISELLKSFFERYVRLAMLIIIEGGNHKGRKVFICFEEVCCGRETLFLHRL